MVDSSLLLPADPGANYLAHKDEIDEAIHRVLDRGWYILGDEVRAFEEEFGRYLGIGHAVGVGSGTDALHLALRALGVGPGDAVFTVSHTAVATIAAIELAGASPILVDIDPATFTMDPNRLEDTLRTLVSAGRSSPAGRPRAIIPVHLYGHPADMTAIVEIATRYELAVLEDCAQSHGAAIQRRKTGTWGHMAAFSFYPTKNLGALGDGGAIVTNQRELAEHAALLREYGWRERYVSEFAGMNTRLDELQAAVLRVKLKYLDEENNRRRKIANIYNRMLVDVPEVLPEEKPDVHHVYHQYVVQDKDRDALRAFLRERKIATLIHYPVPVHLQPAYCERITIGNGGLTHTERACAEILSLPMHPQLADVQVRHVCEIILNRHVK